MKRWFCVLTALALLAALCGCGQAPADSAGGKPRVIASAFPEYDFVRAVAGDCVELRLLLKPGTEPHAYEPSPQDIIAVRNCDLFVYGGGESDVWIDEVLAAAEGEAPRTLALMEHASLREEELQAEMTHDHEEHGHEEHGKAAHEEEYDEHVWTSPVNVMRIAEALRDALSELDAGHAETYKANTAAYLERLTELDAALRETAEAGVRKKLVFGDRFPFLYLVREYGLDYAAAFPGCSSGTDADPATIAALIDTVEAEGIRVVFKCDLSAGKVADTISEATGAAVGVLYSCHTLSKADFDAGETYLSMMARNVEAIREALG